MRKFLRRSPIIPSDKILAKKTFGLTGVKGEKMCSEINVEVANIKTWITNKGKSALLDGINDEFIQTEITDNPNF